MNARYIAIFVGVIIGNLLAELIKYLVHKIKDRNRRDNDELD